MTVPRFDIFYGRFPEADIVWMECVEGLGAATERMKALAAESPGPYFVFDTHCHAVMASIDTSTKANIDSNSDVA
jgi:hypothetical protein